MAEAAQFVTWLRSRGKAIADCEQADVDEWFGTRVHTRQRLHGFIKHINAKTGSFAVASRSRIRLSWNSRGDPVSPLQEGELKAVTRFRGFGSSLPPPRRPGHRRSMKSARAAFSVSNVSMSRGFFPLGRRQNVA